MSRTMLCLQLVFQHARKFKHHELAVVLIQRTLREGNLLAFRKRKSESVARISRRLVQQKGLTVGLLSVWQRLLEMQVKSFHSVPRSNKFKFCRALHWQ